MAFRLLARPLSQQLAPRLSRTMASKRHRGPNFRDAGAQDGERPDLSVPPERQPEYSAPVEPPVSPPPPASQPGPSQAPPEPAPEPLPVSRLPSLDFAPEVPGKGGRTGARAARDTAGPSPNQRTAGRLLTVLFVVGVGAGIWHLGRDWDPDELKRRRKVRRDASGVPCACSVLSMVEGPAADGLRLLGVLAARKDADDGSLGREQFSWLRGSCLTLRTKLFREPAWEELLPPPMPPPHQKPYTLLLSIDDLLVTSTWDVRPVERQNLLSVLTAY